MATVVEVSPTGVTCEGYNGADPQPRPPQYLPKRCALGTHTSA